VSGRGAGTSALYSKSATSAANTPEANGTIRRRRYRHNSDREAEGSSIFFSIQRVDQLQSLLWLAASGGPGQHRRKTLK
jgi:hypothetical protein